VSEGSSAISVADDWRRAAGVDVGEQAEVQVVTTEKGGREARAARGFVDRLIDLVRDDTEGIHHVDNFFGEKFGDAKAEGILRGGCDGVGIIAFAGDVGEEEDEMGAGGYCIEEVAASAGGVIAGVQIEVFEGRQSGRRRSAGWMR
jgi:hypothetical protein